MKHINSFKKSVALWAIFLLIAMGLVISYSLHTQKNIFHAKQNREHALDLAQELFQSSEDLTRMARAYVITGNPVYKQNYFHILDIRNGKRPRPLNYSGTYWHLSGVGESFHFPTGEAIPLQTLMRQAGITDNEFMLLKKSQANSDELVNLEKEAFAAIEGLYRDDEGAFTVHGTPNHKHATNLLFGKDYIASKAKIMEPISQFMQNIDKRTDSELSRLQVSLKYQIIVLLALVIVSLAGVIYIILKTLHRVIEPLEKLAYRDPLTGLLNRHHFMELAYQEINRSVRYKRALSVLMIDIDHFKKINDTYGHPAGDQALIKLSQLLRTTIREIDLLCRYGGEEFVILLPETNKENALLSAERLRLAVETSSVLLKSKKIIKFTISTGVATLAKGHDNIEDMLNRADIALYAAKDAGRNCIQFER